MAYFSKSLSMRIHVQMTPCKCLIALDFQDLFIVHIQSMYENHFLRVITKLKSIGLNQTFNRDSTILQVYSELYRT